MNKIEEPITEWFGERCPDTQQGCACCDAWAEYDVIKGLVDAAASMRNTFIPFSDDEFRAIYAIDAALAAAKAVQHD